MTRSRLRKLRRLAGRCHAGVASVPLAAVLAASMPVAVAQESEGVLETIVVTAQKRQEDIQDVPVSIQALGSEKLEELHVANFEDYAKFLPSVSYQTLGPGFAQVYMRGVASGGDGNHSGSLPSVGMYLDEQPITTISGSLDIHMYDIARVEALAGPQGTLYGASSQAGTVRIITNKPDPSAFASGYSVEANAIDGGGIGHVVEGFANTQSEGEALQIDNPLHPSNSRLAVARSTDAHLHAIGLDWDDVSGRNNGHFAPFAWRSS